MATVEMFNGKPVENIGHLAFEVEKILKKFRCESAHNQENCLIEDSSSPKELHESGSSLADKSKDALDIQGDSECPSIFHETTAGDVAVSNGDDSTKRFRINQSMMRFDLGNAIGKQRHIVLDPAEVVAQSDKILKTYKIERNSCAKVAEFLTLESGSSL